MTIWEITTLTNLVSRSQPNQSFGLHLAYVEYLLIPLVSVVLTRMSSSTTRTIT